MPQEPPQSTPSDPVRDSSCFTGEGNVVHGGDLAAAQAEFGALPVGWMDLSTGISPWGYPTEGLPPEVWQQLPGSHLALLQAASQYYQVPAHWVLPVPGSQYALSRIPQLIPKGRVALPSIGYREHQNAWLPAGHRAVFYHSIEHLQQLVDRGAVEHVVLINPNNPSAEKLNLAALEHLANQHANRGLMLVDEAFADFERGCGAAALMNKHENLWVLRSLGKFFGLAGLRLGFLLGNDGPFTLAQPLAQSLTPWGINHPAQWLGTRALLDTPWQTLQRKRIQEASTRLTHFWQAISAGRWSVHNGGLFVTLRGPQEVLYGLYQHLGRQGIYLRWCHWPVGAESNLEPWLRCGLPVDGGERLQQALASYSAPVAVNRSSPQPP